MNNFLSGIFLLFWWAVMLAADFFFAWFKLPDAVLAGVLYWFVLCPAQPLWRWVLPVSLLMDVAADVPLGFHALLYTLAALAVLPLLDIWRSSAPVVAVFIVIGVALLLQILRCLLHFFLSGIPAPSGWLWIGFWQAAVFLPVHWSANYIRTGHMTADGKCQ